MRAFVCSKYGPPEALDLDEVEKPVPQGNEVQVRVHAASVNPVDWHLMRGKPILARLVSGLLKPKDTRIGADLAGRVEAIGADVKLFRPGDDVFGTSGGSFAEYAVARDDRLALKPANLSYEAAAAVPVAGVTALQGLRDKGRIRAGQKVLINGAAGGVGTFAVQLAKAFGGEVTGVCSTRNLDLVRSIGADHVIDYTKADFTETSERYDLILDAVANHTISEYSRVLNPRGVCLIVGFSTFARLLAEAFWGQVVSRTREKKIGLMGVADVNHEALVSLQVLLESGKLMPVIDRRYPFEKVPDAIRYLEGGHAQGKVVITMG
jgi:NADPH:quinone reductase-like Zn-dependent oxidoreductase